MPRKIPPLLSLALTILIRANGWRSKDVAAAAGITPSTLSAYETGEQTLTRERLDELAEAMGAGPDKVVRAIVAAELVHPVAPPPVSPVDPTGEEHRVLGLAKAMALAELADLLDAMFLAELRKERTNRDLAAAEELWVHLEPYSSADRRTLVAGGPEYQTWALSFLLCDNSEKAAPRSAKEALELAELAVHVARHVPDLSAFQPRLEGWAEHFLANALRVSSRPREANGPLARGEQLWQAGSDPAGLLDEGRLLDLKASIVRAHRRFEEALALHDQALEIARPDQKGVILLNKGFTLEVKGDYEAALAVLEQAEKSIDGERQPRLLFGQRFNRAAALCRLGRAAEAAPIVVEVRELGERLGNDLDLVRTLWLEALVLAGTGRLEDAVAILEQVRRLFANRGLAFPFALANLDLALLYREQGRLAEVCEMAAEMLKIFEAQSVHREALAAVVLFRETATKGEVTVELVRRLQDYLKQAQYDPELRFKS
jgi:tetratricopeptide (TPR) repeat protein